MSLEESEAPRHDRRQVKVVLVDVDGTLIDTNDAHAHAWVEAFAEVGRHVSFETLRPLMGMGGDQILPRVIGVEKESKEGKRIADIWSRIFRDRYLPQAKPFPGAEELLRHIHTRGVRLVAASSGEKELADALLDKVGVGDILPIRISSADAKHSKPAPDIIEVALKKGGANSETALLLGDTPYDIEAARAVGVGVIAFRSGGFSDEALQGAVAIYDGPADLLAHWDSSPLAYEVEAQQY